MGLTRDGAEQGVRDRWWSPRGSWGQATGMGPDQGAGRGEPALLVRMSVLGACAGVHVPVPHGSERGAETLCGGEGRWGPFGVSTILASHWGSWQIWDKTLAFLPE